MGFFPAPKPEPKKKKNDDKFDKPKVVKMFRKKGITACEVNLPGCEKNGETPAHRHKRRHYKNKGDLINSYNEIVVACPYCHDILEQNAPLTEKVFLKLRGSE